MGMNKQLITFSIVSFFFVLVFSGCTQQTQTEQSNLEKLVGTWKEDDSTYGMYVFFANGTCLINTYSLKGTYVLTNETLTVHILPTQATETFDYTLSDIRLMLTNQVDGFTRIYTKQV